MSSSYMPGLENRPQYQYTSSKTVDYSTKPKRKQVDEFDSTDLAVDQAYESALKQDSSFLPKAVQMTIAPQAIDRLRFSQMYIDPATRGSLKIEELASSIMKHGWDKNHPIHIIAMPDEEFTSLDNRRLAALKMIREKFPQFDLSNVNVILDFYEDQADPMTYGAVFTRLNGQIDTLETINTEAGAAGIRKGTYGHCVIARMHGNSKAERSYYYQTSDWGQSSPYGYDRKPIAQTNQLKRQFLMNSLMNK